MPFWSIQTRLAGGLPVNTKSVSCIFSSPPKRHQTGCLREETVVVAQKQGRAYAVMMWLCDVAVR